MESINIVKISRFLLTRPEIFIEHFQKLCNFHDFDREEVEAGTVYVRTAKAVLKKCMQHQRLLEELPASLNASAASVQGITFSSSPLHYVAQTNGFLLNDLLNYMRPSKVNAQDGFGRTPLHLAVAFQQPSAVDALLKAGASLKKQDQWKRSPLALACLMVATFDKSTHSGRFNTERAWTIARMLDPSFTLAACQLPIAPSATDFAREYEASLRTSRLAYTTGGWRVSDTPFRITHPGPSVEVGAGPAAPPADDAPVHVMLDSVTESPSHGHLSALSPGQVSEDSEASDVALRRLGLHSLLDFHSRVEVKLSGEGSAQPYCDLPVRQGRDFTAEEFLRDFLALNRPVLVRQAAHPSMEKFKSSFKLLTRSSLLTNAKFANFNMTVGGSPYADSFERSAKKMTLPEFVKNIMEPLQTEATTVEPTYVFEDLATQEGFPLKKVMPDFFDELVKDDSLGMEGSNFQLYVGPALSGSPLHHHLNALNILYYGSKQWFMIPPQDGLYQIKHAHKWFREDFLAFRNGAGSEASAASLQAVMMCVQQAGDLIYVPDHWSHSVINLADSVGTASEFGWYGNGGQW